MKAHTEEEYMDSVKEVPAQLDELSALLEELDKSICSLEKELEPVLSPDLLKSSQDETKERQLVPLANLLRERCNHTKAIIQHVGYLHQGLQI